MSELDPPAPQLGDRDPDRVPEPTPPAASVSNAADSPPAATPSATADQGTDDLPPILPAPVAPPPLPIPPPLPAPPPLPETGPASPRDRVPAWLIVALCALAAMVGALALTTTPEVPLSQPAAFYAGEVLGVLVVFPGLIMALFAITRSFRSWRRQSFVLLGAWSFMTLSLLIQHSQPARLRPARAARDAFAGLQSRLDPAPFTAEPPQPGFALPPARPFAPAIPPAALRYDFSPGSDQRLTKLIDGAQEKTYHDVVAAYAAACSAWPDNDVLALERVRFIARYAQAEDVAIDSAADDFATAKKDLLARFPAAPGTVLYVLETSWGEAFEREARRSEPLIGDWPRGDRAKFYLLRAQRERAHSLAGAAAHARLAFDLQPSADAGLLLAQADHAAGRDTRAAALLRHSVFSGASPWIKRARMDLLFELHENAAAGAAYDELATKAPEHVRNYATAEHLARIGRVADARALLTLVPQGEWNREQTDRQRFEFELAYGQPADAAIAYRRLRAHGLAVDPFARARFALLAKAPRAGWTWADCLGLLMLGALLAGAAALPVALLGPVHYWSFWRQRAGKISRWSPSPWGLKTAWFVGALVAVGQVLALWSFQPQRLAALFKPPSALPLAAHATSADLAGPLAVWALEALVLLALFWRSRAWSLFGRGRWSFGTTLGAAIGSVLGIRLVLALYILWVPAAREQIAPVASYTMDFLRVLQQRGGPLGLIGVVAIAVPVIEEMIFRGVILGALARHVPFWAANVLQAAVFASLHENLLVLPFLFALALIAGDFVRRSGSLRPAILLHAANNLLACLGYIALSHMPAS